MAVDESMWWLILIGVVVLAALIVWALVARRKRLAAARAQASGLRESAQGQESYTASAEDRARDLQAKAREAQKRADQLHEQAEEATSREEVLADLRRRGLLREDASVAEQVEALHAFLTLTPAKLVGVSVSDLAGDTRVINQPGTDEEYPNWRVPLAGPDGTPVLLEELVTWRSARRLASAVDRRP